MSKPTGLTGEQDRRMSQLLAGSPKNWGRWGPDDQIGALNFLTSAEVLRGVRAIRQGKVITCGELIASPGGDPIFPSRTQPKRANTQDRGDYDSGRLKPLPGGDFAVGDRPRLVAQVLRARPFVSPGLAARLVASYGTRALRLLDGAREEADLGRVFGADLTEAEVRYLMREEWARTAGDVLWRRTKLGLRFSAEQAAALDAYMRGVRESRPAAAVAGGGVS